MNNRVFIFLLIAAFSVAVVTMIELGIRSAVLSPFILFDSNKEEEEIQKAFTGYSIYQGDYLLNIQSNTDVGNNRPLAFQIGHTNYQFRKINRENLAWPAGKEMTVVTRRGIEAALSGGAIIQSKERKLFFNQYTVLAPDNDEKIAIHLKSEFSQTLIFFIYFCSILMPSLLALFFNVSFRNLFTLFFPFILAGILPLLLNYHFTMGSALLLSDSYIWSIILCIFFPSFLSMALTTAVYQYTVNRGEDVDASEKKEMKETGFFYFTRKEMVSILLLVVGGLAALFSFFLIPLSVSIKITDKWYLFILWYLSLTFLVMMVYTGLHRFMRDYTDIGLSDPFLSLKKVLEEKSSVTVRLFMKRESEDETNAWVYSVPFAVRKGINIYMIEGLM